MLRFSRNGNHQWPSRNGLDHRNFKRQMSFTNSTKINWGPNKYTPGVQSWPEKAKLETSEQTDSDDIWWCHEKHARHFFALTTPARQWPSGASSPSWSFGSKIVRIVPKGLFDRLVLSGWIYAQNVKTQICESWCSEFVKASWLRSIVNIAASFRSFQAPLLKTHVLLAAWVRLPPPGWIQCLCTTVFSRIQQAKGFDTKELQVPHAALIYSLDFKALLNEHKNQTTWQFVNAKGSIQKA